MDIDTVIPAAVNIEANLEVAAGQAERKSWGKGDDEQLWGKGKGSPGQGGSVQANTFQKGGSGGKQKGAGRQPGLADYGATHCYCNVSYCVMSCYL